MNLTKRDIADIVLVWMAMSFILVLLNSILAFGAMIGMPDETAKFIKQPVAALFQGLHLLAVAFVTYILLFKRNLILDNAIPDAGGKDLSIPDAMAVLTGYTFWIRLFGIYTFLSSGIAFVGDLVTGLGMKEEFVVSSFWLVKTGPDMVAAFLALLLIWKADRIAVRLGDPGSSNRSDAGDG